MQIVWDEIVVSKPDLSTVKFQKPTDEFLNFRQLENAIFGNSILNGKSAHPHPSEVNEFFVNLKVASVGDWVAAGTLPCPRPAKQNIYGKTFLLL